MYLAGLSASFAFFWVIEQTTVQRTRSSAIATRRVSYELEDFVIDRMTPLKASCTVLLEVGHRTVCLFRQANFYTAAASF